MIEIIWSAAAVIWVLVPVYVYWYRAQPRRRPDYQLIARLECEMDILGAECSGPTTAVGAILKAKYGYGGPGEPANVHMHIDGVTS